MSNRLIREGNKPEKPTITETECARRMTVHAARVQLFTAAGMCDATRKELAELVEALPMVRRAGETPIEVQLGAICLAAKEFILGKLEECGLIDSMPPPEAINDNGRSGPEPAPPPEGPKLVQ